jgi:hypothetical protein
MAQPMVDPLTKAAEDLANALVPVVHSQRFGLPNLTDRARQAYPMVEALLEAGGRIEEFESEYPHLSDALYAALNA